MRRYLLAAAVLLSTAACTSSRELIQKRAYHDPKPVELTKQHAEPAALLPAGDTSKLAHLPWEHKPSTSLFHRLFSSKQPVPTSQAAGNWPVPGKCKGCVFNVVAGNQTNSAVGKKGSGAVGEGAAVTTTTTGKNSGPAVINSDSSTQNAIGQGGNISATNGNNNATEQTKQDTTKEAPGPLAVIADNATAWLPWVAGGAAVAFLVFFLIRRKAAKTLV
ncbi:hypothetical protein GO988_21485 [Hymenobacter sp. HMF4947]|uniref:Uncharacterized protein n=1 Tax=Hymenobacter ginkgonis TaxID=2682976 RepID=A0A7K1TKG7_9BACT|nr:hypothetical protein [Hymenobacter ginkgonis]MVN78910.1 hypothetical protein [Hymenobacter ginkgonis]